MLKKEIAAIMLCIQIISSGTVYAIPKTVRQAGIVDDLADLSRTYTVKNVQCDEGAYASSLPAEITYRVGNQIENCYIAVSDGKFNTEFKLYSSVDGVEYTRINEANASGEMEKDSEKQTIYEFNNFGPSHRYIKIEPISQNLRIKNVFVNVPLEDPELLELFIIKTGGGSTTDREITQKDVDLYKQRYIERYLSNAPDVSELLNTLQEDGSWENITYTGETHSGAHVHCTNLVSIAKAVSSVNSPLYKDEDTIDALTRAVEFWMGKNIDFVNWYYDEITIPRGFGEMLLAAGELLPSATEAKAREYLLSKLSVLEPFDNGVGSNVVETQLNRILYGVYVNDLERVKSGFDRLAEEITVVNKLASPANNWRDRLWEGYIKNMKGLPNTREGIQVDYSILFHGPLLYSGGYGVTFLTYITRMLQDTEDTNLLPKEGVKDYIDQVLEHFRWITRGQTMDYNTIGRNIARNSSIVTAKNANGFYNLVKALSEIPGIPRSDELAAYYETTIKPAQDDSKNELQDNSKNELEYDIVSVSANDESSPGNPAINAIDKSIDTRWASDTNGDNITFDLGEEKKVGMVGLAIFMGDLRKQKFKLEMSKDNQSWDLVFNGESSGRSSDTDYYMLTPKDARYIRLTGYGNTVNAWNSIAEVAVFGAIEPLDFNKMGMEFTLIDEVQGIRRYFVIEEDQMPSPGIIGNRHFWKADYTTHQQKNFMLGLRTSSRRTIASEVVSMENIKGDFLADGTTYIYRTGKEYDSIFPAWDWCKIPGTTTLIRPFTPKLVQHTAIAGSDSDYTGGVSDGSFGVTAMQLVRDGLAAKKAWFMFDQEFVALGTDIKNTADFKHITTVNQNLLRSEVNISTGGSTETLANGLYERKNAQWIHQDRIGYIFPSQTSVSIDFGPKTGDRNDISWGGKYSRPTDNQPVTKDIFSVWFDHSDAKANMQNGYEYIVVPEIDVDDLNGYIAENRTRTISNTKQLQAVENTALGVAQAVFWEPGVLTTSEGLEVTVDKPVLIQVTQNDSKLTLAVASLLAKDDTVNIKMNTSLIGNGAIADGNMTTLKVKLPEGDYSGMSLVLEFEKENID